MRPHTCNYLWKHHFNDAPRVSLRRARASVRSPRGFPSGRLPAPDALMGEKAVLTSGLAPRGGALVLHGHGHQDGTQRFNLESRIPQLPRHAALRNRPRPPRC